MFSGKQEARKEEQQQESKSLFDNEAASLKKRKKNNAKLSDFERLQKLAEEITVDGEQYQVSALDNDYIKNLGKKGACELIGVRSAQEDRVAWVPDDVSLKFAACEEKDRAEIWKQSFVELQKKSVDALKNKKSQGTCVSASVGWKKGKKFSVSTAYLGDSVTFAFVLGKNGKVKFVTSCNPELHNASNLKEVNRYEQQGEAIQAGRFTGGMAVSRGIGDISPRFGKNFLHEPQVTEVAIDIQDDDRILMMVACDGITEPYARAGSADIIADCGAKLKEIVEQYSARPLEELAAIVALKAYLGEGDNGSEDNLSVTFAEIEDKEAVTLTVCDGHCGSLISELVAQEFPRVFDKTIDVILNPTADATQSLEELDATQPLDDDDELILDKDELNTILRPAALVVNSGSGLQQNSLLSGSSKQDMSQGEKRGRASFEAEKEKEQAEKEQQVRSSSKLP